MRYSHVEKIGTEANPGKSWFTFYSRAEFPKWDGEINYLNYLYCLISLCISFICFLNPVYSWVCWSYLCKPRIYCSSFYNTHYLCISQDCLQSWVECSCQIIHSMRTGAKSLSLPVVAPHCHSTWHRFSAQFHYKRWWGFPVCGLQEDPLNCLSHRWDL